jgi:alpha-L-rhamnosidase
LFWINMIHDYWMLRDDTIFVKLLMPGVETVLKWYETKLDPKTGMVGFNPFWNFVDWPDAWGWSNVTNSGGIPEGGLTGNSSIISLQYVYALNAAVQLFKAYGDENSAIKYHKIAIKVAESTIKNCWDAEKGILADSPEKKEFSQHANIMAIMADAILPLKSDALIEKVANDKSLIPATIYYRFYLLRAMKNAGLANKYLTMLQPWKQMLQSGLTTFAERIDPTRSDCHAWSASPVYELLATVCGIEPAEPGFKTVTIAPNLGDLKFVEAAMPHPMGIIKINLKKTKKDGLEGFVILPKGLNGIFTYKNITIKLKQVNNIISI